LKVVVTGGAGFIGANVCRMLVADPAIGSVVVVDDMSTGHKRNLADVDVEIHKGSILDADLLTRAFAEADAIIHLAARPSVPRSLADPLASHEANATGTLNVLEAARSADTDPMVIVASSSSVYGGNPVLPKREDLRPMPLSPYAVSKLATESYALSHQSSFGMSTLAFRFFNVFGPLQSAGHAYAAVVPAFVSAVLEGRAIPIQGDGRQSRDFTYVGTVSTVLCAAAKERTTCSSPVNLAFGTRTSLLELITELETIFGRSLPVAHLPERPGDVKHSQADNTLLRDLFPEVQPVQLAEGLVTTVKWLESEHRSQSERHA
jgi:UDP-glucose 4-epimerase